MILLYFSARPKRIRGICRTRGGRGKYYIRGSNTVRDWSACANAHIITRTRTQQCDSTKILKKIKYIRKTTNEPPRPTASTKHSSPCTHPHCTAKGWELGRTSHVCGEHDIYYYCYYYFLLLTPLP